jgi:DNA invertase Pin-like site-specific DNA recombinase
MENNTGIIWARVSSEEQARGYSLDMQVRELTESAKNAGIRVVDIYRLAESAKISDRRREFKKMASRFTQENINYLIFKDVDRLTRSPGSTATIWEDLVMRAGVKLFFASSGEVISRDSPSAKKSVFVLLAILAHVDNMIRSEKTVSGMNEKARQGCFPKKAPVGYLNIPDPSGHRRTIEVDDQKAELVKLAFKLYSTGTYSLATLGAELTAKGFTTDTDNKPITKHGLETVLRNRFYYGEFRWRNDTIPHHYPPLISRELFNRVQEQLKEHCSNLRQKPLKWFAFKPFLKCGYCGSAITAEEQKGHNYYRCTFSHKYLGQRCPQKYFREEAIDALITNELSELYLDDTIIKRTQAALHDSHNHVDEEFRQQRTRLEREQAAHESALSRLIDLEIDGLLSKTDYIAKKAKLQNELTAIQSELKKLGHTNSKFLEQGLNLLDLLKGFKDTYLQASPEAKERLLRVVLDRILLKDEPVFIWRSPFDLLFSIPKVIRNSGKGE